MSPSARTSEPDRGPACRQGHQLLDLIAGQGDGLAGQFLLAAGKVKVG